MTTLGSLFSGSGGFELAGLVCGIQPVFASEIAPFPIRVTTKRLPQVKHLGDVHAINGATIPPVDIITAGSPCTDMSVAHSGKREGLYGKQSSLFFEAIRIIKEMREETHAKPRFFVFENVPGAFSSGTPPGSDFRTILNSIIQIAAPGAEVPAPGPNGWPTADVFLGDGWSVAYRTCDAQHFNVAQRRSRLLIVADFDSERAGEILFESEGVCRDYTPRFESWEGLTGCAADCAGTASGVSVTKCYGLEPGAASRLGGRVWEELVGTLRAVPGDNLAAVVYDARGNGDGIVAPTLVGDHENRVTDYTALAVEPHTVGIAGNIIGREDHNGGHGIGVQEDVAYTLTSADRHGCAYAMTAGSFSSVHKECAATLMARDFKDPQLVADAQYTVRRLMPCECALLQGFPQNYCTGLETVDPTDAEINWWADVFETHRKIVGTSKKPKSRKQIVKWLQNPYSESAEYSMWGAGVALPVMCFVMRGIVELINEE
ncbi:hypothetical protein FACS1894184_09410 [Clostridia bacterium]|nr:hypothetical protein FACS1894184_09410 [Clostridia bacterium]